MWLHAEFSAATYLCYEPIILELHFAYLEQFYPSCDSYQAANIGVFTQRTVDQQRITCERCFACTTDWK